MIKRYTNVRILYFMTFQYLYSRVNLVVQYSELYSRPEGMSLVLVTMVFLLDIGRLSPFGSHLKKEFKKVNRIFQRLKPENNL